MLVYFYFYFSLFRIKHVIEKLVGRGDKTS